MAKSLKSAAKTKTNDLFGAEPKGRAPLKVAQRTSGAEDAYQPSAEMMVKKIA